jgi:hypothetical protein
MEIKFADKKEEENSSLKEVVAGDNKLKEFIVEYAGNSHSPDNDEVTVEMVVETLSKDFPELVLAIAEENWVRGYHQAFQDIEKTSEHIFSEKTENEQ